MISVIIPTYNREKTIARAIDSVLNQTYTDIELIIVDDCSTDNTASIINKYNDNRIRYIKLEKNSGACVARNRGIDEAKGEYIAFQDSDDSWYNDKIEKQLKNLESNDSDLDFCKINVIGERDKINVIKPNKRTSKKINKYGINTTLCYGNFISTQAILGKTECFKKIKFDSEFPRLQDYDLVLRLSKEFKWSITQEVLVDLYVQNDSISKNPNKLLRALELLEKKDYNFNDLNKKIFMSSIYKNFGDCLIDIDRKKAVSYYKKSLKNKFNIKVFIKIIIYTLV